MKRAVVILLLTLEVVVAKPIHLTKEQQRDWQIESGKPQLSKRVQLGKFMAEVVTPPQYLQTISLPFEAHIKKLYVSTFEKVKKGQLLAEVTGQKWIEVQKRFIADAIELKHHGELAKRKSNLCREGIIAKKECLAANAEHNADQIRVSASKALLRSYGASERTIHTIFNKLKIVKTIKLYSKVSARVLRINVHVGESTSPSDALFVFQKEGALWLEVDLPLKKALLLRRLQEVEMLFNHKKFKSIVLLKSPKINRRNQTQMVRFSLPKSGKFITGMRDLVELKIPTNTFKISKKSLISSESGELVFLKQNGDYKPLVVNVVAEDDRHYYVKGALKLNDTIATSSLAILKGLMESDDD